MFFPAESQLFISGLHGAAGPFPYLTLSTMQLSAVAIMYAFVSLVDTASKRAKYKLTDSAAGKLPVLLLLAVFANLVGILTTNAAMSQMLPR